MLMGSRPFTGKTDLEVLQKVIHETPPALDGVLPAGLRLTVEKALEKAADSLQQIRDAVSIRT